MFAPPLVDRSAPPLTCADPDVGAARKPAKMAPPARGVGHRSGGYAFGNGVSCGCPCHSEHGGVAMTVGGVITAIIFGAIIGALARLLVPGKQHMPIWLTILVGIVAAFIGTWIAHLLNLRTHGFNFWETIFQIVVAIIGVLILTALWPRRASR
jgi:uncharacterized membrane protein YeaQ/YmgE (transglycosylase-associated protein family)